MSKHTPQRSRKTPSLVNAAPGASTPIPDKLYFRIGDVAKLLGVEAYVLRFWESEFPKLKPNKSGTGQRLYRRRDVELAMRIKHLLYVEGYTIAGARQVFATEGQEARRAAQRQNAPNTPTAVAGSAAHSAAEERLQRLRGELHEILQLLSAPVSAGTIRTNTHKGKSNIQSRNRSRGNERNLFDV